MPYTLRVEKGSTYFDILNKLAEAATYNVFYDGDGNPRFQPPTNYLTAQSMWNFTQQDHMKTGKLNKKLDLGLFRNSVKIQGTNLSNGTLVTAIASDTNPASPTSIQRCGSMTRFIEDPIITDVYYAQLRADYELTKSTQFAESSGLNAIQLDHLNEDEVITLTEEGLHVSNERYLVRQITKQLFQTSGVMSMEVWKTRSFQ
jgi:hypothetical protein